MKRSLIIAVSLLTIPFFALGAFKSGVLQEQIYNVQELIRLMKEEIKAVEQGTTTGEISSESGDVKNIILNLYRSIFGIEESDEFERLLEENNVDLNTDLQ